MKKGSIVEADVKALHFPNRGICEVREEVDGVETVTKLRVKNVIPGQKITARVAKMKHGNPEGVFLELLKKAPEEYDVTDAEHVCSAFPECGGCAYQTLPYEKQLQLKEDMARELFEPVLGKEGFDRIYEGFVPSPESAEYRNKMEFSFGDAEKDGPLQLGMHRRGSFYDIVDASECRIVDADFRQAVKITVEYFRDLSIPYLHKRSHEGYLRHLLVRKAKKTGELLIDLVTTTQVEVLAGTGDQVSWHASVNGPITEQEILQEWVNRMTEASWQGTLTGILHTRNDSMADVVMDEGTDVLYGKGEFEEELLGLHFTVTPFSFFQTNSLGAEKLYELGRQFILGDRDEVLADKTVFDLYSGTGTIAQILSPSAGHIVGVEIVPEAVEAAKINAAKNGITNCEFLCGDVLKVLDEIEKKPDMIVLDPPRDGVHPKALPKILAYGVDEIIYIACKPTSLQRDIPYMMEAGYEPVRMACVDMFPVNPNFETCMLFTKKHIDD